MLNELWLSTIIVLFGIIVFVLFAFYKAIRNESGINVHHMAKFAKWKIILVILAIALLIFGYFTYYFLKNSVIDLNMMPFVVFYIISAAIMLIVAKKAVHIVDEIKKKKKKLMDLNFVLDTESQYKADNLEDKNEMLARQAEILSEKEVELKRINTELVRAEEELEEEKRSVEKKVVERTQELQTEKVIVEDLLKQKTRFINQLSHDLRTPLIPLLNLLPILRGETKEKESVHLIDICIKNAKYLEKLVLSTLNLARIGSKKVELDISDVSFYDLIEDIIHSNKINYKMEKIKVINKISKRISMKADELRMREVFENLINNAIKYNENKRKEITVTSKEDKTYVEISFKDNGIGIEAKDLNNIFAEFYKVDPSRHQHDSSGLGLSIANAIVQMHNGDIHASSNGLKKGSTFTIKLPK